MAHKGLRLSAWLACALGMMSISLTGEISSVWLIVIWSAWLASPMADRAAAAQASLRRFETAAVVGMIGLLLVDFFIVRNTVFIAVAHFLLFFQVVKLAGEKRRKDCLQIFLVSFFQILAACTLSVDAWHAAILLAYIPMATAALFWNQMDKEHADSGLPPEAGVLKNYRRMMAGICVFALPLNLLLTVTVFVIFPRLSLNAALPGFGVQRMGYADQVNLAQTGSLKQDSAVALWLSFPKREQRMLWQGYLRGDVLGHFDGRQWSVFPKSRTRMLASDTNGIFSIRPAKPGAALFRESITIADPAAATLFSSGEAMRVAAPLVSLLVNDEGALHWSKPWRRPLHYDVISAGPSEPAASANYLELPAISLERIRGLTRHVAGRGSALAQAQKMTAYLRENYKYSIDYGNRIAENPVDYFLFDRRQGACGHFASALALMLRIRGIPSRVVAGYFKGEWNEPAQCVVIRERDAHAWVEAYIRGKGWIAFDPTPVPQAGDITQRNLWHLAEEYWDYASYQWNRLVIEYDLYSQIKAIQMLKGNWWPRLPWRSYHFDTISTPRQETDPDRQDKLPWITTSLVLACAISAMLVSRRRTARSKVAPIRFYNQFLARMARAGHAKTAQETGWEFAQRLVGEKPEWRSSAWAITEKYYLLRFARGKS